MRSRVVWLWVRRGLEDSYGNVILRLVGLDFVAGC